MWFNVVGIVVFAILIAVIAVSVRTFTQKRKSLLTKEKRIQVNCAVRWIAEQMDQGVFPPGSNHDFLMDGFMAALKKAITPVLDKNLGHLTLQWKHGESNPDRLFAEATAGIGLPFSSLRLRDGDYLYAHIEPESVTTSRDPSGAVRYTLYSRKRDLR